MTDQGATSRCPVCGAGLAGAGDTWCPRCALTGVLSDRDGEPEPEPDNTDGDVLFTVPGHKVLAELGRGAAGIVYRARQERPVREVALKILRPHEAGSVESRARFRLEAVALAGLDHPVILPVLSVGEYDGLPYFTMKLCAGGSLAERLGRYQGNWRTTAQLMATLADAVHYAHLRGVLHRDLKPGNVLFDEADRPFVSDFGLAKLVEASDSDRPVTRPLVVMGTPGYLAPEVLTGGANAATTAADVYALGAILQELLTGAPPPAAPAAAALPPGVPRDLAVIAAKCLLPEPAARYASAAALAEDLRAWLDGRPIAARPVSALGQSWAWARRNPALAGVTLTLALTLVGATAVLAVKNRELDAALARAQANLAEALVAQARAVQQSGQMGQRFDALALLAQAAKINPGIEARNEAAAALALPDWTAEEERRPWTGPSDFAVPSANLTSVLVDRGDGKFSLHDMATGVVRWAWQGNAWSASIPVFSPDGRWVAVRLTDDTVEVRSVAAGKLVLRLEGRPYAFKGSVQGYGHDMDFSPDGARLAVTLPSGGVSFHRLPGGEADGGWVAPEWVTAIAWSPDGTRLAVGGGKSPKDNILAVIDAASGRTITRLKPLKRTEFVAWSPDGRWLATRESGGLAEVRASSDLALRAIVPDRGALYARFLSDGRRLLLSEQLGLSRLWDIDRGQQLLERKGSGRPGSWYAGDPPRVWNSFSAGPVIMRTLSESPVLAVGRSVDEETLVRPFGAPVSASPDGRWLMVCGWQGGVIYDVAAGRFRTKFETGGTRETGSLRMEPSGRGMWVALEQSGLWYYPLASAADGPGRPGAGEQIDAETGFYCADLNVASGRLALVRLDDGSVKIMDIATRRIVARWKHAGATTAAFSPDGSRLVVNANRRAGTEQPAAVHDTMTGAVVRALGRRPGGYSAWSPDGRWIYAGDDSGVGVLWRTADWTRGPNLMLAADDLLRAGAFSPDGRLLALADTDADLRLVETATGRILVRLAPPEPLGFVAGLVFAGQDRLCAVNIEGRVFTWNLTTLRRELAAVGLDWADKTAR